MASARSRGGIECQRAGQEVHPEVGARARADEVVDLLVGLGVAKRGVHLDATRSGTGSPIARPISPASHLGDERARSLARSAELHDVQAVVVRLDEPGQRAALAQWHDVAGRDDGPDHRQSVAEWRPSPAPGRGARAGAHRSDA